MLSVIIPTLNAAATLGRTLACVNDYEDSWEIIVVDGGSTDETRKIAVDFDARIIDSPRGRGHQLATGASVAQGEWLLFVHADTAFGDGWAKAVRGFMDDPRSAEKAGYFRLRMDDNANAWARRLESMVARRCLIFGLPYGDQGLLISRQFYDAVGGYLPLPIMEDVNIVRRISKRRLTMLDADAITSAERYLADGYIFRSLRNLACLSLYFIGLPPRLIARIYQ